MVMGLSSASSSMAVPKQSFERALCRLQSVHYQLALCDGFVRSSVCQERICQQSCRYVAEQQSKRWMSRGTFGTNLSGGEAANVLDVNPRNAANISVMSVDGRLYALFEGGQPHELDPETLQTLGITTFNGLLEIGAPFNVDWTGLSDTAGIILSAIRRARGLQPSTVKLGGDAFASHYRRDHRRQRLVCMSFQVAVRSPCTLSRGQVLSGGARLNQLVDIPGVMQVELQGSTSGFQTNLRFYELSNDMQVLTVHNFDLPGYAFIHDFAITEDSIVLMVNASSLHLQDFLLGRKGVIHSIHYDESKPLKVRRGLLAWVDLVWHKL